MAHILVEVELQPNQPKLALTLAPPTMQKYRLTSIVAERLHPESTRDFAQATVVIDMYIFFTTGAKRQRVGHFSSDDVLQRHELTCVIDNGERLELDIATAHCGHVVPVNLVVSYEMVKH